MKFKLFPEPWREDGGRPPLAKGCGMGEGEACGEGPRELLEGPTPRDEACGCCCCCACCGCCCWLAGTAGGPILGEPSTAPKRRLGRETDVIKQGSCWAVLCRGFVAASQVRCGKVEVNRRSQEIPAPTRDAATRPVSWASRSSFQQC